MSSVVVCLSCGRHIPPRGQHSSSHAHHHYHPMVMPTRHPKNAERIPTGVDFNCGVAVTTACNVEYVCAKGGLWPICVGTRYCPGSRACNRCMARREVLKDVVWIGNAERLTFCYF